MGQAGIGALSSVPILCCWQLSQGLCHHKVTKATCKSSHPLASPGAAMIFSRQYFKGKYSEFWVLWLSGCSWGFVSHCSVGTHCHGIWDGVWVLSLLDKTPWVRSGSSSRICPAHLPPLPSFGSFITSVVIKPHVGMRSTPIRTIKNGLIINQEHNQPQTPRAPLGASTREISTWPNPAVPGEGKIQTENVVFLHSNTWAAAEEMPQSDAGGQPLGKILSLDRLEAKKVLEIYVKRSLSCHENSHAAKKNLLDKDRGRGRKVDGLQRSESDFCMYSCAKPSPRKDQERLRAPDLEEALGGDSKASQEVPKEGLKVKRKSSKNSSKPAWLKGFLNLVLKKSPEDQKENTGQKAKEKDAKAPQGSKPEGAKKHRVDSGPSPTLGRALKKKPSLKKVFSLKKHGEEERGEPGSTVRGKRPSCLPLRHVLAPAQPGGTPA